MFSRLFLLWIILVIYFLFTFWLYKNSIKLYAEGTRFSV